MSNDMTCYVTVSTDTKGGICLRLRWNWYHIFIRKFDILVFFMKDNRRWWASLGKRTLNIIIVFIWWKPLWGIYWERERHTRTEKDRVRETCTYIHREECDLPWNIHQFLGPYFQFRYFIFGTPSRDCYKNMTIRAEVIRSH